MMNNKYCIILSLLVTLISISFDLGVDGFVMAPSSSSSSQRLRASRELRLPQNPKRPAPASTVALTSSSSSSSSSSNNLEEMDRHDLLDYLNSDSDALGLSFKDYLKREQQKEYLQKCPVFNDVAPADLDRIAASMVEMRVEKGSVLIQQGDMDGDAMYFLIEGELVAKNSTGSKTILKSYENPGDYFGELALIFKGQVRQATIEASATSTVYKLDKNAFRESMQDSPVFDTARQMLLKKYQSKRLMTALPRIQINEIADLLTAKLQYQSNSPKNLVNSLFSFVMGASFTILASLWSGGVRDSRTGWPMLFDLSSSTMSNLMLPVQTVSVLLAATAILGHVSVPKDDRPTVTMAQRTKRRLHRVGVWSMVLLLVGGTKKVKTAAAGSATMSMLSLLPLQMLLAIVLETTKGSAASPPTTTTTTTTTMDGEEQAQQLQLPKSRFLPAIASCVLLGYEVLRGVVGSM